MGKTDLCGHPRFATPDDKGHLFVNFSNKDAALEIDSCKMSGRERWLVLACVGRYLNTMHSKIRTRACSSDAGIASLQSWTRRMDV